MVGNPGLPRQAHPSARVDAPVTAFPGDDEPRLSATLTLLNSEARPSHFMASELVFPLQPQRDSNPCRHLERAIRPVHQMRLSYV